MTKMYHLPVQKFDETSHRGNLKVVLQFIELAGVLVQKDVLLHSGRKKTVWRLSPDWEERRIYLNGDGLTIHRVLNFDKKISEVVASYMEHYKQMIVVHQALTRCTFVHGALHLEFHLADVYISRSTGPYSFSPSSALSTGCGYQLILLTTADSPIS